MDFLEHTHLVEGDGKVSSDMAEVAAGLVRETKQLNIDVKIPHAAPSAGNTCYICDEQDTDGLEACANCYNCVWSAMVRHQETLDTDAIRDVVKAHGLTMTALKNSRAEPLIYTMSDLNGNRGSGITKAEALADLLAKLVLEGK